MNPRRDAQTSRRVSVCAARHSLYLEPSNTGMNVAAPVPLIPPEVDAQFAWLMVDGSVSAHFEHTVAITKDGPVILTR
jgi:hypothetical protein